MAPMLSPLPSRHGERSEAAYKAHLATPHFRKYKDGTPHMIKSLKLVPMRPLDENGMKTIFRKKK